MSHPLSIDFHALAARFDAPGVRAIALFGSHARSDANALSDVDITRFVGEDTLLEDDGSHLIDDRLVVVSSVQPQMVEAWFTDPG